MSKLYPPIIEETLPAFYSENGIVKFTIPFSMNRAVSFAEIGGFELKIKTVQNGTLLYTLETYKPNNFSLTKDNLFVTFYVEDTKKLLKVGQFYKLQLAYIYTDENIKNDFLSRYYNGDISIEEYEVALSQRKQVGYYSGAAVAKYTTKPNLYINNLRAGFLNSYSNSYTGCYEQISSDSDKKDSTEKVYYYKFDVYDNSGKNIFYTTGYKLHNTALDMNVDYSQDLFDLNQDIEHDNIYYIQYSIITTNGLSLSTPKYKIVHRELIDAQINVNIDTVLNTENGYIDIQLISKINDYGLYDLVTGAFLLLRADEDSHYKQWSEMTRFILNGEVPSKKVIFRDYTVEQGKKYQYAIQQYGDSGLYSNKILSNIVQADFEYAFLYDGKRQLKIKYNPKITKFTNTRLEQKIDTIGGKHPFIFRNGQVNYNEFPIGGLISYFMDEEKLFMSDQEFIVQDKTTNYTVDNMIQERIFKMKVLEWINNGEPKIFRSPTEGNFIIRLLKISLSPEQKLGNLLHNFSGTAYEIADYNYENLRNYNFLNIKESAEEVLNFMTVDLKDIQVGKKINKEKQILQTVRCDNMTPGEQLLISFTDGSQEIITIGATGRYFVDRSLPIEAISILPRYEKVPVRHKEEYKDYYMYNNKDELIPAEGPMTLHTKYFKIINKTPSGLITYSYLTTVENTFGLIENVIMDDCTIKQFIGAHDILKEIRDIKYNNQYIKNPKYTITDIYSITVRPRPLEYCEQIIENSGAVMTKKDSDIEIGNIVNLKLSHPFSLYSVKDGFAPITPDEEYHSNYTYYQYNSMEGFYYIVTYADEETFKKAVEAGIVYGKGKMYDYTNTKYYKENDEYEPYIWLNGEQIYITHETELDLLQFNNNINELKSGNGVVVDIVYQTKSTVYTIESIEPVYSKKQKYLTAQQNFEKEMLTTNVNMSQIKKELDTLYNDYIQTLILELIKEGIIIIDEKEVSSL